MYSSFLTVPLIHTNLYKTEATHPVQIDNRHIEGGIEVVEIVCSPFKEI